jgi:Zn-dependent peptidase ImmA (M78 family)
MTPEELRSLPKYAVIRALLDGSIPFDEIMRAFDIHLCVQYVGPEMEGMVYRCSKGHYHVVISDALSPEARQRVLFHEIKHIIEDMPTAGYAVYIDKQYEILERQADLMAREVAAGRE